MAGTSGGVARGILWWRCDFHRRRSVTRLNNDLVDIARLKIPADPYLNCHCITRRQVAIAPPAISNAATAPPPRRRYSPGQPTTAAFNHCIKTSLRSITVLEGGVPENRVIPGWIQ
uniref:Uncharacterized protein n=1 Tax=Oryza punctata TaxID=4537 RepID=A0A0E0M8Q6_ORYPU